MTKQELIDKHAGVNDSSYKNMHHAKISTLFAISVLGELQDEIGSLSPTAWQVIKDKKEELKSLIQ